MQSLRNKPDKVPGIGLSRLAAAKINLYLHVTGRRDNGYHELDSLVAFASVGDKITVSPDEELTLEVTGPEAGGLNQSDIADNLVLRAARMLAESFSVAQGAAIRLDKRLPVASGIGGGSADAAATITALVSMWGLDPAADELAGLALKLGADIPVCLASRTRRMTGIGEFLQEVPVLPESHIVLVNPRLELSTPDVFTALHEGNWQPRGLSASMPADLDFLSFIAELKQRCNELQDPAINRVPEINDVLAAIEAQSGCRLARMSGSGATCYGLFETAVEAARAAEAITQGSPAWWVQYGQLGEAVPDLRQAYTG